MNEMEVLQEAFGFDEPSLAARTRARAALLEWIHAPGHAPAVRGSSRAPGLPPRRRSRWAAAAVAAAVAVTVGVVAVKGVVTDERRAVPAPPPAAAAPPYARPAGAAEYLENVAWAAARRPWVPPRPDQFMYIERIQNNERGESWMRVDGRVRGWWDNGRLRTAEQGAMANWPVISYAELAALTTPDRYEEWQAAPKPTTASVEALLFEYVLPPEVEAAIFRWVARQAGVRVDTGAVNIDGRPAIAVTYGLEGFLQQDLLFDPQTYGLIGIRLVAVADHVSTALDGQTRYKAGDVLRLEVRGRTGIVDKVGDVP